MLQVVFEPSYFPAVTFCNLNNLMKSKVRLGGGALSQTILDIERAQQKAVLGAEGMRKKRSLNRDFTTLKHVAALEELQAREGANDVHEKAVLDEEKEKRKRATKSSDASITAQEQLEQPLQPNHYSHAEVHKKADLLDNQAGTPDEERDLDMLHEELNGSPVLVRKKRNHDSQEYKGMSQKDSLLQHTFPTDVFFLLLLLLLLFFGGF